MNSAAVRQKNGTSEKERKQDQRARIWVGSTDFHISHHNSISVIPPTCTKSPGGKPAKEGG